MKLYQPVNWHHVFDDKVYKLLEDFALFHGKTFFVWDDFSGNIMQDDDKNLVFIDLDDASSGIGVDIVFSDDVLDYFLGFSGKTPEHHAVLRSNIGVDVHDWEFV